MHYIFKVVSAARLRVVKVFFVSAAAIVADLFVPAAAERFLLARILAVASFIGASLCVFIDQDSID